MNFCDIEDSIIMSSARKLRFMSWNSNGLKSKIENVKTEIQKQNCDVVFIQQTRSSTSDIFEKLKDYKSLYTTQTSKCTGVAILIKKYIYEETSCTIERDPAGCYILVKCTLNGQLFTLMSVYNCHTDIKPLLTLKSVLEKHAEGILLIGGDFNVALNPYLDRISTTRNKTHSLLRPIVKELMTSFNLVDVWRRFHPTDRQYSYQQKHVMSRLDYIFVPEESMRYIEACEISRYKSCSDHYPVGFEVSLSGDESKKLELFLIVFKEEDTKDFSSFQKSVVDKWLSCKRKYWPNLDLPVNPHTPLMISVIEVEQAIQSLVVKHTERPDGFPLSFYKSYSYVLIPYLCAFYQNILEQPTNIPGFNEGTELSVTHYIFNIDYLILATIMARWLYEHLQSHSTDYTVGKNNTTVLFTLKEAPIKIKWPFLQHLLVKEQSKQRTEPPLQDRFKITVLHKMLKETRSENPREFLLWGCPLTPVLMTLYLKHVAKEMIENVKGPRPSIHISRENVTVRFTKEFDKSLLKNLKDKYNNVDCTILENTDSLNNWDKLRNSIQHDVGN